MGRREQNPGGALRRGAAWKSVLGGGCSCHMASFSLWENRLSFISVSWMYRITLVSARREAHLREHLAGVGRRTVRSTQESYGGPRLFPSSSISTSLQSCQVRILVLTVTEGERSPWRDEEAQGCPRLRGEPALVVSHRRGASTFFTELP